MNNNAQSFYKSFLPESILVMIDEFGLEDTLLLVKKLGGTRLFIPKTASNTHPLAELLGIELFTKLCKAYPSVNLNVPRCLKALTLLRDAELLAAHRGGLTLNDCARKYNLTERGISKALRRIERYELAPWVRAMDIKSPQADLFTFLEQEQQ